MSHIDFEPAFGDQNTHCNYLLRYDHLDIYTWLKNNGPFKASNGIRLICSKSFDTIKYKNKTLYIPYITNVLVLVLYDIQECVCDKFNQAISELVDKYSKVIGRKCL